MSTAIREGESWVLVEENLVYDPIRGKTNVRIYEGDLLGINYVINGLYSYERIELSNAEAPKIRLIVYSPDLTEAPVWELLSNLREKDIYEHEMFKTVSDENIQKIVNFIKKPTVGAYPALTGTDAALALELYKLLLKGTKKYFTQDYVLRYSLTVTNAVQLNMAYANTGRVFVKALTGSNLILPAGISASISNIPDMTPADASIEMFGWLKQAPTARQTQIGKVVITQEYWLNIWSKKLYPPA